jgi:ribokinase
MSIICLGSINIDDVYTVSHIAKEGETITSTVFRQYPGGKGANQSVAIAKAGGKVFHVGAVGKDGVWLKELMHSHGVQVDKIFESAGSTGKAIIQVSEKGENAIVLYPGANYGITNVEDTISRISDAKWLLCQGELMTKTTIEAIKYAKGKGLAICLNPAPLSPTLAADLDLSMIDLLVANEIEFEGFITQIGVLMAGDYETDITNLMKTLPDLTVCVLTLGSIGGIVGFRSSGTIQILSFNGVKVKAIDTTGAGDTFVGYFLANLVLNYELKVLNKENLSQLLNLANTAAALSCTKSAAMNSIPDKLEVLKYIGYI